MKFSTQEEYGLRCLLQIARHGTGASMTIPEISLAEGLSAANVAKLLRILRLGGFVESARGQTGGYSLARPPDRIRIADVLALLGGRLVESDFCVDFSGAGNPCTHSTGCSIFSLWSIVQKEVDKVLENTTLQDLIGPAFDPHARRLWEISIPAGLETAGEEASPQSESIAAPPAGSRTD